MKEVALNKAAAIWMLAPVLILCLTGLRIAAQPQSDDIHGARPASSESPNNKSIEQQRLELERQKAADEHDSKREELRLQKYQMFVTAFATIVPLLAVLLTLWYNARTFRQQTQQLENQRREDSQEASKRRSEEAAEDRKRRTEDARLQFELKTAEIAFAGDTPLVIRDRARALKAMFGADRLPDNFLSEYDPSELGEREGNLESKKLFLDLLLKYPAMQYETLCFWKELFPGDVNWLERVHLSPHAPPQNANEDETERLGADH